MVEVYTRKKMDNFQDNQCYSERWVNSYSTLEEFSREWGEDKNKETATHFFFETILGGYRQGGCKEEVR